MVLLRDFYAKKGGRDFDIIGVCLDDDPAAAKQYLAQNKFPWKQIYETGGLDGRLANEMGVITLPLMILVDQKGNVANQNVHVAELDAELAKLAKPAAGTANAARAHRRRANAALMTARRGSMRQVPLTTSSGDSAGAPMPQPGLRRLGRACGASGGEDRFWRYCLPSESCRTNSVSSSSRFSAS